MTHLYNEPATFTDEALAGFCDLHQDVVRQVHGGVIRRCRPDRPKVAVLPGGGSGHYPAFFGIVGPGFADGAVCGNLFTSPSALDAYSVAMAADSGAGVVFTYGNYAGDVMNFGLATDRLRGEGVAVENVVVTDDIASAPPDAAANRRGIAGDFPIFKIMSAASEEGMTLAEVTRIGRKANAMTRTIGAAFAGCTFPGAEVPLFTVPKQQMGLGLGIHGEPGLKDVPRPAAKALALDFVERVLTERPESASDRICVILNGLGAVKHEELFVMWSTVATELRDRGHTLVMPEVGELVTSLDMAAVSLTITWLDAELERLWTAPAYTPAWRRGQVAPILEDETTGDGHKAAEPLAAAVPLSTAESREAAAGVVALLATTRDTLHDAEAELGAIDAIAGDGDHGRGMVRGVDAAHQAAVRAAQSGGGAGYVLTSAADAWADRAGGTSGVLWGAGLQAAGEVIGDVSPPDSATVAEAVAAFAARICALGGAVLRDKTMVDALLPFTETLTAAVAEGLPLASAWGRASDAAGQAARATTALSPRKGRARPLAEKSIGTPDAGATSLALIVAALSHDIQGVFS